MARAFKELKCRMVMQDIIQDDICNTIGKSKSYVTARMAGRAPWNMDEIYAICRLLEIDLQDIPKYFPPKGKTLAKAVVLKGA